MKPDAFEALDHQAADAFASGRMLGAKVTLAGESLPQVASKNLYIFLNNLDVSTAGSTRSRNLSCLILGAHSPVPRPRMTTSVCSTRQVVRPDAPLPLLTRARRRGPPLLVRRPALLASPLWKEEVELLPHLGESSNERSSASLRDAGWDWMGKPVWLLSKAADMDEAYAFELRALF